ncbi:MAG: DUF4870 domain-containing protein [Ardenticatenaceae bacterium]|nr:DUF4870 domain-containing protein [Ardenticatenaceae bacterium]MCB9443573.1 DUF4870 domain-containing protein [Ardenticatenaceae bacterium]
MTSEKSYSQEERLLAALAHAAIITGMIAPVAGLLIYITQKEKSSYAAGQGMQAAIYQLLGLLVMILAWSCWGVFYTISLIPLIANADQYNDAPPAIFWVGLGSMVCPFIVMALWGLYGLWGAVRAWTGADFRYLVIGQVVEKRLMKSERQS